MFSKPLVKILEAKNCKQADLARGISVSESQVSRYCSGSSEPNYSTIQNISKFFNIEPAYFFSPNNKLESVGKVLLLGDAILQVIANHHEDNFIILTAKFLTSNFIDKKIARNMKKHKMQFVMVVKSGKVLVDNKPITFDILDSVDTVFVHANSTIQLIVLGDTIQFTKQIKKDFPRHSLL